MVARGNAFTVFGALLVASILAMLGTVLTCFIGGLAAITYFFVFGSVAYLLATGQRTISDRRATSW